MSTEISEKLALLGLTDQKLSDALKNKKLAAALSAVVQETGLSSPVQDKSTASLLQSLASSTKDISDSAVLAARPLISEAILARKIKTSVQVDGELLLLIRSVF